MQEIRNKQEIGKNRKTAKYEIGKCKKSEKVRSRKKKRKLERRKKSRKLKCRKLERKKVGNQKKQEIGKSRILEKVGHWKK